MEGYTSVRSWFCQQNPSLTTNPLYVECGLAGTGIPLPVGKFWYTVDVNFPEDSMSSLNVRVNRAVWLYDWRAHDSGGGVFYYQNGNYDFCGDSYSVSRINNKIASLKAV